MLCRLSYPALLDRESGVELKPLPWNPFKGICGVVELEVNGKELRQLIDGRTLVFLFCLLHQAEFSYTVLLSAVLSLRTCGLLCCSISVSFGKLHVRVF